MLSAYNKTFEAQTIFLPADINSGQKIKTNQNGNNNLATIHSGATIEIPGERDTVF